MRSYLSWRGERDAMRNPEPDIDLLIRWLMDPAGREARRRSAG
jgi:hypothetical protein